MKTYIVALNYNVFSWNYDQELNHFDAIGPNSWEEHGEKTQRVKLSAADHGDARIYTSISEATKAGKERLKEPGKRRNMKYKVIEVTEAIPDITKVIF